MDEPEQHNDHCLMRYDGDILHILGVLGPLYLAESLEREDVVVVVDLSKVDWDSYVEELYENYDRFYPGWR